MPRAARLPNGLTVKEEKFCLEFFATGDASDAYRKVYGTNKRPDGPWVNEEAARLIGKNYIQKRVESLRSATEKIALYTADAAMAEAGRAYDLAEKTLAPAAMVSAVTLRAKLAGHLVEKRETTHKTLKNATTEELMKLLDENAAAAGLVIQKAKQ